MNFKIFCVIVIVIVFGLFIGYKSIHSKVSHKNRVCMVRSNCSLTSRSVHIYLNTCQFNNSFHRVSSLASRIMGFFDTAFCPLRIYVSVFLEQEHPDYVMHFTKELKRLDSSNHPYPNMSRIEIIPSNLNFTGSFGVLHAMKQIHSRTNFKQIRERDFVLLLDEHTIMYENWDKNCIKYYSDVRQQTIDGPYCITYVPTCKLIQSKNALPSSSLSGDLLNFVKSNTVEKQEVSVPEYTPSFPVVAKDNHHVPSLEGRQPTGRIMTPVPVLGASSEFCFIKKSYIDNLFHKVPNNFSVTRPNLYLSMLLYNMNVSFFMPPKSLSYIIRDKYSCTQLLSNNKDVDEERTMRLLKKRMKQYERFLGIKFPNTLTGRACMGIVDSESAFEIVSKYGSMSEFERVKSYLCKD